MEPRFAKGDHLPDALIDGLRSYRKKRLTQAVRIRGPFWVETREGELRCEDGYLAWDSEGYPYPIAREEFEVIYEPAGLDRSRR